MELFNGIILLDGKRVPFTHPISEKLIVQDITIRNHPAYNRKGDAKQLTATANISQGEYLVSYGGHVRLVDADGEAEWNPYQAAADKTSNYYIDGEEIGNEMRYINDAKGVGNKQPNVEFFQSRRRLQGYFTTEIFASQAIKVGEELLVSYGDDYWPALKQWYDEQHPFACPNCDFRTAWTHCLIRHMRFESGSGPQFECDYCGATFKTSEDFHAHVNIHTADIIYRCDECDFISLQKNGLAHHVRAHHEESIWRCFQCQMILTSASNLKKHVSAVHSDEKPHACDKCDYKTARKDNLKAHVERVHAKKLAFACDDCKYRAATAGDLKKHVNAVHHDIRTHNCESCRYAASSRTKLKIHVERVHEKKRPFACDDCDYTGFDMQRINRHKRIHL